MVPNPLSGSRLVNLASTICVLNFNSIRYRGGDL